MRIYLKAIMATLILAFVATAASAQNIAPDDRYKGYPTSLVGWPDSLPNLATCVAGEYYEASDTHLLVYTSRVKIADYRVLETDECRWMRTSSGDRWILRPIGTKIAIDAQGRDLFDMGSPNGKICGNPSPFGFAVNVPVLAPEPPASPILAPMRIPRRVAPPAPRAPVIAPPAPRVELKAARKPRFNVTFGVGYTFGTVRSKFYEDIPNSGDVRQNHNFRAFVPWIRLDQGYDSGVSMILSSNVLGSTSDMEYVAIDGPNTKRRDSDSSVDKNTKLLVGYRRAVGEYFTVAGFGGGQWVCFCGKYTAQGADTITKESYRMLLMSAELVSATQSFDHRFAATVGFDYGFSLKRTAWTQQIYQGTAFPRANNDDADGHSVGFRIEANLQAYKGFHVTAGWSYLGLSSTRTNTFTAEQHTAMKVFTLGINYRRSW